MFNRRCGQWTLQLFCLLERNSSENNEFLWRRKSSRNSKFPQFQSKNLSIENFSEVISTRGSLKKKSSDKAMKGFFFPFYFAMRSSTATIGNWTRMLQQTSLLWFTLCWSISEGTKENFFSFFFNLISDRRTHVSIQWWDSLALHDSIDSSKYFRFIWGETRTNCVWQKGIMRSACESKRLHHWKFSIFGTAMCIWWCLFWFSLRRGKQQARRRKNNRAMNLMSGIVMTRRD